MIIGIDCSRAFGSDRTGTENYSYHVISHMLRLPEAKKHHFVLYTRPNAVIEDWVGHSSAEVVNIPRTYLWTQYGLAEATWRRKLDVLWVPAHTLPVFRKPGIKTVVSIHGLEYRWLPEYNNLLQRWYLPLSTFYAVRAADHLIAVSSFTRNQLISELGVSPEKITMIHEGYSQHVPVKKNSSAGVLRRYDLESHPYILFVGTLQPRKNLPALIQAYARVRSRYPDHRLVIAGSVGWMADDIFRAVQELSLGDTVIFTGRAPDHDLADLYAHARVYVQPSFQEGFGLPVLEAMRARVPVITSDGGALPEIAGDAGIVVPLASDFVNTLAAKIESVLKESKVRQQLIRAGMQRTASFPWEKTAEETLKVLLN